MVISNPDNTNIIEMVEKQKQELDTHNIYKARGAEIRSRIKYIQEGEKNTKYFLSMEAAKKQKKIQFFVLEKTELIYMINKV